MILSTRLVIDVEIELKFTLELVAISVGIFCCTSAIEIVPLTILLLVPAIVTTTLCGNPSTGKSTSNNPHSSTFKAIPLETTCSEPILVNVLLL